MDDELDQLGEGLIKPKGNEKAEAPREQKSNKVSVALVNLLTCAVQVDWKAGCASREEEEEEEGEEGRARGGDGEGTEDHPGPRSVASRACGAT